MRRISLLLLTAVALFMTAGPAAAEMSFTPMIGTLVPAKNLIVGPSAYVRMKDHTIYGFSVDSDMSDNLGVSLTLGMGKGTMELVGNDAIELSSTALLADLRARMGIAGGESSNLGVVAGVGFTDFKTGYFDYAEEIGSGVSFTGRLTGIAGLNLRSSLSDRLHLDVTMADRIHVSGVDATILGPDGVEKTQHDLMATLGLRFPL